MEVVGIFRRGIPLLFPAYPLRRKCKALYPGSPSGRMAFPGHWVQYFESESPVDTHTLGAHLGREDAVMDTNTTDALIAHIEAKGREIAAQLRQRVKDGLMRELREELAMQKVITEGHTEAALFRGEMKGAIARLEKILSLQWLITLLLIIFLNQNFIEALARWLGRLK